MKITSSNVNLINFTAINLQAKEKSKADKLIAQLPDTKNRDNIKLELLDLFDKHIQKEAALKSKWTSFDDYLQKMYLNFFEAIENIKNLTTQKLIDILDSTAPDKNKILTNTNTISDSKHTTIEITETSKKSKAQLKRLREKTPLTDLENEFLEARASGKTLNELSIEKNRNLNSIRRSILNAVAKIQDKEGILPKEFESFTNKLINEYNLTAPRHEIKNLLLNNAHLMNYPQEKLLKNIDQTSALLKISPKEYVLAALKQTQLFYQKPETIENNIVKASKLLQIESGEYTQAALKQPQLFYQKAESVAENIYKTSEMLEIPSKELTKAALNQPQLFYQKSDTILSNINTASKLLQINPKELSNAALRHPTLFCRNPQSIAENINILSAYLSVPQKQIAQIALKNPTLFCLNPNTIIENIKRTAKLLKISNKEWSMALLKQPPLFYMKPETISGNIKNTAKLLKINSKQLITSALKQPPIFCYNPETIVNNIKKTTSLLSISQKDFIQAALKHPTLFYLKPETIAENVTKSAKLINLSTKEYNTLALKKPTLFYLKPETIAKKANLIRYYKQIQNKSTTKTVIYLNSDQVLYETILNYLVKKADKLSAAINKNEFIEYLKKADKIYNLEIPANEIAQDFIKFTKEFSAKNFGKQIFSIKIK